MNRHEQKLKIAGLFVEKLRTELRNCSTTEAAAHIGASKSHTWGLLGELVESGVLARVDRGRYEGYAIHPDAVVSLVTDHNVVLGRIVEYDKAKDREAKEIKAARLRAKLDELQAQLDELT